MLLRYMLDASTADERRSAQVRAGRFCLSAGLLLNTLAYLTGRFGPLRATGLGDFVAGMACGMAILLIVASIVLARKGRPGN